MNAVTSSDSSSSNRILLRRFLIGFAIGVVLSGTAVSLFCYSVLKKVEHDVQWNWQDQVTVIVVASDVQPGTVISADNVKSRPIPRTLATASVARNEDFAKLYGARIMVPLTFGDPIRWGDVELVKEPQP